MSKSQFAACARKTPYATSGEAEKAARGRLAVYLCPICTRYHLTSSKPSDPAKDGGAEVKPTFDGSLLGRAKLKKARPAPVTDVETAVCLGKPRPDGRIRLAVGGRELLSEPVQPASLRLELKAGDKVRVKIAGRSATVLGTAQL